MNGKTNRTKGHNAEREYAKLFKSLGYDKCVTSRYGSRLHDDAGIDLINIPFNVQIKTGYKRGLNYSKELYKIDDMIQKTIPKAYPEHTYPNILIHKKFVGQGRQRNEYDELVVMSLQDFISIISKNKNNDE